MGKQNRCGYKDGKKPPCPKAPLPGKAHCAIHTAAAPTREIALEQAALGGRESARAALGELAAAVQPPGENRVSESKIDPNAAAMAAAQLAARERSEARAAPVPKPAQRPLTPVQEATENAIRLLTAEKLAQQERLQERQRRQQIAKVGNRTPLRLENLLPKDLDPFDMVDPDGTPWGKPGTYKRWVKWRSNDPQNRAETEIHINQFKRLGGDFVRRPDGTLPERAPHGVAMEIDTRLWGQYILRQAPTGCFDHEVQLENMEVWLDQENSRKGYKGAELVVSETHGSTAVD